MDFSPGMLFAGFVFGVFGMYFLKQGRKRMHFPFILIAIALIAFPYFISSLWLTWVIGIALLGAGYLFRY